MTRVDLGGFALNIEVAGQGPPVVLLHGFTGSAAGWGATADVLADEFTTLAVDIVGHGKSDAPAAIEHYRMERCVDDLVSVVGKAGYGRACWLGYSMGARTALQVATRRPQAVSALVLEGGSPGLETEQERAERVRSDEALAERIEREGVPAFVAYWESIPLFSTQSQAVRAALRTGRMACDATGLANSLRGMGTGAQPPLYDRLAGVRVPVLLLTGELDVKFTGIAAEMARALPDATIEVLNQAGHAAHLEQPDAFHEAVLTFLRRVHASGGLEGHPAMRGQS